MADFAANGPARRWLTESAGLSEKEAAAIARRTGTAFDLLQADCRDGRLRLDLDPVAFLRGRESGTAANHVSCEIEGH